MLYVGGYAKFRSDPTAPEVVGVVQEIDYATKQVALLTNPKSSEQQSSSSSPKSSLQVLSIDACEPVVEIAARATWLPLDASLFDALLPFATTPRAVQPPRQLHLVWSGADRLWHCTYAQLRASALQSTASLLNATAASLLFERNNGNDMKALLKAVMQAPSLSPLQRREALHSVEEARKLRIDVPSHETLLPYSPCNETILIIIF